MLLKIYPENPAPREVAKVVECLRDGGLVIFPTDTVYGLGCDMTKARSIEQVAKIKGVKPEKADFSIICHDLSHISDYTLPLENSHFKLMKSALPGPFTFILKANNRVPKIFKTKRRSLGIRIPDNNIPLEIVRQLGNPIITTSIKDDDDVLEYTTDPELIYEKYRDQVDIVIDGGFGNLEASTVVDCTGSEAEIIRQGIGEL